VPEVVDDAPYGGGTHFGGHILDRLGIAVVPKTAKTEASLLGVAKRFFLVISSVQPLRNCDAHGGLFRRLPPAPAEDLAGTVTGILRCSAR
jgi:hypothetical protein